METIYIAETAQGSDTGADAANAHSASWFNTAGNWSSTKVSGKVGPGDVVHLVGTLITQLVVQGNGSSGNVITILFDPGAKFSSPTRTDSCIYVYLHSFIVVDGGATGTIGGRFGDPALANGLMECTDNGTELTYQNGGSGVFIRESHDVTVKGLVVANMYVRTRGGEQNAIGAGISASDVNEHGVYNILVKNCIVHDAYIGINTDYGPGGHDYTVEECTVYNCNWGVKNSDRNSASTMTNFTVKGCWLHDWANWDDTVSNSWHHNGVFVFANYGVCTNISIYDCWVSGKYTAATGAETNHATSGFYVNTNVNNVRIYNNVLLALGSAPGNGLITVAVYPGSTDPYIFNNTLVCDSLVGGHLITVGWGVCTYHVKNNICVGGTAISRTYAASSGLDSDNNIFYTLLAMRPFATSTGSSEGSRTFAEWQGLGYDAHSIVADPLLDGTTYKLGAGSPAIGAGADLSTFFNTDAAGLDRPNGSAWDLGPYQYAAISPTAPAFTVDPSTQTANQGDTVTLTALASGSPTPTYQWKKNGTPITGATSSSLALYGVQPGDAASYTCTATNTEGSATSDAAVLTVIVPDPADPSASGIYRFAASTISNPMILLPAIALLFLCAGCSTFRLPRIAIPGATVTAPKNAGKPATMDSNTVATEFAIPAGATLTVEKLAAVPASPKTETSAAALAQPAKEVRTWTFPAASAYVEHAQKVRATTGTIDTSVAMHAADNAERRILLWVAIVAAVAFVVLRGLVPAWPILSNSAGLIAALAFAAWKFSEVPEWILVAVAAVAILGALFYKRGEWDANENGVPDALEKKATNAEPAKT